MGAMNIPKVKVRLEGLGCANCALKMEEALSGDQEIGETTINFTTKTMYLPETAISRAQIMVDNIEPGVQLVPITKGQSGDPSEAELERSRSELKRIILAGTLFAAGLVAEYAFSGFGTLVSYPCYVLAYLLVGWRVLRIAGSNIWRGRVFDENFLMALATLGAMALNQWSEAVGVMLFYAVGAYVEGLALNSSRRSIQDLMNIRPEYARLIRGLKTEKVDPEEVEVGDQVMVHPGEKIPLDGEVLTGESLVNTAVLTGESVPRRVRAGDSVLAGTINISGVLKLEVKQRFAESSVQRILDLMEHAAARKAPTEKFITTFARYYTPVVVIIAVGIAVLPALLLGGSWADWLYRALTILVISCPCALVISIPLGYFGGISGAARQGILVKGANSLDGLRLVNTVVFDKTGTLTEGVFEVVEVIPAPEFTAESLLILAARAEAYSSHPIAQSIIMRAGHGLSQGELEDFEEIAGMGVKSELDGQTIVVGKQQLLQAEGISIPEFMSSAYLGTVVYVGIAGRYAGKIVIADRIKDSAWATIRQLNESGRRTVMLTGDNALTGQAVAERLGISEYHADLLPEDKVRWLERFIGENSSRQKVVFVGDGINDAPVIARADIGVAMGGLGSDAAIEAADMVFMEDNPAKLLTAIEIADFTKKIVWQNIIFALAVKSSFLILGAAGNITMWEAVFADVGVALLAILNANRVRQYSPASISQTQR